METNYFEMFAQAFIDGIPVAVGIWTTAFQAQPWTFIAIAALGLIGLLMPARKRRRRRAY